MLLFGCIHNAASTVFIVNEVEGSVFAAGSQHSILQLDIMLKKTLRGQFFAAGSQNSILQLDNDNDNMLKEKYCLPGVQHVQHWTEESVVEVALFNLRSAAPFLCFTTI